MQIPTLDIAWAALRFYHEHVVTQEAEPEDIAGLPDTSDKLAKGYDQCMDEALAVCGSQ